MKPQPITLDMLNALTNKPIEPTAVKSDGRVFGTAWGMYNDGGIETTDRAGGWNDCAVRALAIASNRPYIEILDMVKAVQSEYGIKGDPQTKGVLVRIIAIVADRLGATLKRYRRIADVRDQIGRYLVLVPGHAACVIDGVLHDTYDSFGLMMYSDGVWQFPDLLTGTEDVVRRIRKLRAKADSSEFDNERDALIAKATEMQIENHLSEAAIQGVVIDRGVGETIFYIDSSTPYAPARRSGLSDIAHAFGLRFYYTGDRITMVGSEQTCSRVISLFLNADTWLVSNIGKVKPESTRDIWGNRIDTKTYRASYVDGYFDQIGRILKDDMKAARAAADTDEVVSAALVVVDQEKAAVKEHMDGLKLRRAPASSRSHSQDGYGAGAAAGRAHMTKGVNA